MSIKIYILKLKSGRLYVGQSTDPRRRFFEHQAGKGANVCKIDRPKELLRSFDLETSDPKLSCALESFFTLKMMDVAGPMQCSGGDYCHEMYRQASPGWLSEEMNRLQAWANRVAATRGYTQYPMIIKNFITWADGWAQQTE